jgi:hypothetical protein
MKIQFFNKIIILLVYFILLNLNRSDAQLKLNGIYKGENIYIENPYTISGVGFCVTEILVNGNTTTDEIHSSFFEIDLSIYNFKYGDLLEILIHHKDDCKPRVLNPEVLTPESTFEIQYLTIDKIGLLKWATMKEHGALPFDIEQFKWNKWIQVGTTDGKGTGSLNRYSFDINLHTGKNKFRVKQIGCNNKARYSNSVEYTNSAREITFIPGNGGKVIDQIFFSDNTSYEIYDYYGKLIKTGNSDNIKVSTLKPGTYFLNYDNKTETFIKK